MILRSLPLALATSLLLTLPLAAQEPSLSDLEKLKIENLNLKSQLAQVAVKLEQAEAEGAACKLQLMAPEFEKASSDLVKAIEEGHPGFSFDPKSGAFVAKQPK